MSGKLIVFDVDGVLVDSSRASVRAFRDGIKTLGHKPPGDEEIRRLLGRPALEILRGLGCPDEVASELYERHVRPSFLESLPELACCYEGTVETLHELTERGYALAVCTSASLDVQEPALRLLGLVDFFSRMQTSCRSRYRKPDPAYLSELLGAYGGQLQEVWHIEDTEDGLQMGKANEAKTVFAEYGFGKPGRATPDYSIGRITELIGIVDSHQRREKRRVRSTKKRGQT